MSSLTLRFLAEPGTSGFRGKVHGGTVMKWIDEAGYACATAWSRSDCFTAYVSGMRFMHPIRIGDLVEVEARLAYTGTTSMAIAVEVSSRDLRGGGFVTTAECLVVFVAVDGEGKPMAVETWQPETPGEIALEQQARTALAAARGTGHSPF